MNIASWYFLEKRFAPMQHYDTTTKTENALFLQWASGIQSITVRRRERSSRMHSKKCNLPLDAASLLMREHALYDDSEGEIERPQQLG